MFVLLFHSVSFEWPKWAVTCINLPLINIFFDGPAAVAMFFVLSGFVLSRPYLLPIKSDEKPRTIFLPTFYLRRLTRIWLPWFFAFCLCAVCARYLVYEYNTIPAYHWLQRAREWQLPLTLKNVLHQIALSNLNDAGGPHLVSADWSLGVELRASLLVPLFVLCARGWRVISLLPIAILLFVLAPNGYYVSFVLGVALARVCDWSAPRVQLLPWPVQISIFAAGILMYESGHFATKLLHWSSGYEGTWWCVSSLGCTLLLLLCLSNPVLQKILNHKILVFFGRISYSVYLLQFIGIFCLQPLVVYALNCAGITQTVILLPTILGVNALFTIMIAAASYQIIEKPSIELGHKLTKIIQQRFLKFNAI